MSNFSVSRIFNRVFGQREAKLVEKLPDGLRIYAIGDVHGCWDQLANVWERMDADLRTRPVDEVVEIFLGDYIDRGPDTYGVIEAISSAPPVGHERVCLRGNHEQMLLNFLDTPNALEFWRNNGALETLASYGVDVSRSRDMAQAGAIAEEFRAKLPAHHLEFIQNLPIYVSIGPYYFVHAGVRPGVALEKQRQEDMLWIRDAFLHSDMDFGKIVVHGHSPVERPDHRPNRINVDTGAYLTGKLSCVALEGDSVRFI